MPDKSVIQMSKLDHLAECKKIGEATLIAWQSEMYREMTPDEIKAWRCAWASAWDASYACIIRKGNCKFERDHDA